ncbi:hypothetical protein GQ54DRAFT_23432 [Martensiomyces pterosporus]|nr:hypothetical protein GQ54DRAFT_23432 [Martensiomyces pterosporus]
MIWSVNMDYNNELMNVVQSWQGGGLPSSSTVATSTTAGSTTATSSAPASTTKSSTTTAAGSTTSVPVSSTTTSATSGSGSGPVAGGACSTEGAYQCADTTGKNANYFLCLYGKWLAEACGTGTACFQSGTSVTCNWPSS